MRFGIEALRTLAFLAIVFGNQAITYTNRERRRIWSSKPGHWVILSSMGDILVASMLAIGGIAMTALPVAVVVATLATAVVFAFLLDLIKVPTFHRLGIV
jgi:H+-transporting ATPase